MPGPFVMLSLWQIKSYIKNFLVGKFGPVINLLLKHSKGKEKKLCMTTNAIP